MPGARWLTLPRYTVIAGAGAGMIGGLLVLLISAWSARSVVRPRRNWRPKGWTPPALPVEPVWFCNASGCRLAAWFLPPPPGGPVALICHGFGTNRREAQDLLPWLHDAGYGALLLDFQAHGESDGACTTVGLREVDDVLAAVAFLQERLGEAVQIVAIGFSMGGSIAIMGAAQCAAIRAVVADSAFATLTRAVGRSFRYFFGLPPHLFLRPTLWFAERFSGGQVGGVRPIDFVPLIAPRPLLLIHGTIDRIVDPEDCELLYAAAGEPKELWQVPDCDHVRARALRPEEYRCRVLAFLERALQGADGRDGGRSNGRVDAVDGTGGRSDGGADAVDGKLLVADDFGVRQLAVAHVQRHPE